MLTETVYGTLLLLTAASLGFAQMRQSSEAQLKGLMAFEREIDAAAARGDVAFLARARRTVAESS